MAEARARGSALEVASEWPSRSQSPAVGPVHVGDLAAQSVDCSLQSWLRSASRRCDVHDEYQADIPSIANLSRPPWPMPK